MLQMLLGCGDRVTRGAAECTTWWLVKSDVKFVDSVQLETMPMGLSTVWLTALRGSVCRWVCCFAAWRNPAHHCHVACVLMPPLSPLQTPMDLGTVLTKAQRGAYPDAAAAYEDVRLVWRNCRNFNEPSSDVYKGCDELAGFVDQLWRQAKLDRAPVSDHDLSVKF